MFGGSSSPVDRPPGHRRHHHQPGQEGEAPHDHVSRPRANVEILARRQLTALARHRGSAMHPVQHTPGLTGAAAGQLPPFVASGVNFAVSSRFPNLWGGLSRVEDCSPSVLRISPTETGSDFFATNNSETRQVVDERERRRRGIKLVAIARRAAPRISLVVVSPPTSRRPRLGQD